jgi:hypothetical protein
MNYLEILFIFILHIYYAKTQKCPNPYSHCEIGKPDYVNVHIVPHTHDDVGWLKTADQYFDGSGNEYGCVRCILDSVINELQVNSTRRFVYVEMAFFYKCNNNSFK